MDGREGSGIVEWLEGWTGVEGEGGREVECWKRRIGRVEGKGVLGGGCGKGCGWERRGWNSGVVGRNAKSVECLVWK